MKKRSEGQRRFLISFRNQLAAEAVAALCLNDSLDSHSPPFPPLSLFLSLSSPSFCDVCLSLCVSFSCLLCCCCDGSAFISIKCKSQARIFPIERRFRATDEVAGRTRRGGWHAGQDVGPVASAMALHRVVECFSRIAAFCFPACEKLHSLPLPLPLLFLPCPFFYCS